MQAIPILLARRCDAPHRERDRARMRQQSRALRALLLGSSVCLNVINGDLQLGHWQRVFLAELDGRQVREIPVLILGEGRSLKVKMILPTLTEAKSPFWRPIKYALFPPLGLATLAGVLSGEDDIEIQGEHVGRLGLEENPRPGGI